jgi:hypothetical protein
METQKFLKEASIIFIATLVIALSFTYPTRNFSTLLIFFTSFLIIITANFAAKKFFAYNLETNVDLNLWSINHFGLAKSAHFNKPLPMLWLPILTSLISLGKFIWIPIIEFDVSPRPERISRRHGLYRYTEVTEWHLALIAAAGIFINIVLAIIAYFAGFEQFTKLSVMFAFWNLLPVSRLDGSKIFFGSKNLWFALVLIVGAFLIWGLSIN